MRKIKFLFFIAVVMCFALNCQSEEKKLVSIEYFTGYNIAKLDRQPDYRAIPFIVDFTFPLNRSVKDCKWQFQLEPFLAYVNRPESNGEAGCIFFVKYRFMRGRFEPYIKAGSGIVFLTQDTSEQSTIFNFASQFGVGVSYRISGKYSVSLECRYRHVSNCGIKEPNSGIDSRIYLLGITYHL